MMQKVQRFGSAMFVPVLLFAFSGIIVGLSTLFKNKTLMGPLADPDGLWYQCWYVIEQGGWTVFNQMPLLFAIGIPVALAKKAQARACLEALTVYLTFNYFINAILTVWGGAFHVDMTQEAGGTSGLTMIAGIKTLDTNIIGAIFISSIVVYLHNRYFDKKLPDFLGIFQGSSYIVIISFFIMIPISLAVAYVWPMVQSGIGSLQSFLVSSGAIGVWIYTFLERILIPTGLHHFIYSPFVYGPAVAEGGIVTYWAQHLGEYSQSVKPLKELFPQGGFALHGNSKIFGIPGIALAFYATASKEKKKIVAGLLIPVTLTSIVAGITEPIEFTFLFISPFLFAVHALLAASMATVMYMAGVVGNMGGGLIEAATLNWIPLASSHGLTYVYQIIIGLCFTAVYFFVFRFLILKFNIATPGREKEEGQETKLYSKKEYRERKQASKETAAADETQRDTAALYIEALGGKDNITEVTNCATRLRVTIADESKVKSDADFRELGAHGVVRKGRALQVIVGLGVPQMRERVEKILNG
ncbi:alpha-glucoside-specific PTS transporter subunit IIBC [Bacillus velezensis]|uniref:alpha-glucoside-specific PTS transporter subunit IIBC n=1 Tax=Bacillus velezensis TaxID=492670 RepID=UPI000CE071AD|nr:alpha-glucoside-specific PTS transporter subunit IIBC [Bacillus velezensis]AVB10530.1 PTS alpha-glucoside transporter subunit IIBC [Bacillus velezensis]MCV2523902.1 alpha-glucoside-specific PTS transporter subunit IIBC [Bacillus velezensis]MEC0383697.1 alpha-glucoside-specific PTS transporter subunit IIBC [Bacillus velezensis]MEC0386556.1 alpha-glucoside-specific PTS transporter subunit IIBC [Bacillus velezensis]MEC0406182.1 alpha-glucoside-specific PTS transporter subunit IIBC [Bacillus ve